MRFKRFIAVFCLSAAVALGGAGCNSGAKKKVADKQAANKRWAGARAAVLGQLAFDQYKSGNFDKARQSANDALKLSPDNAQLRLLSAKIAIEQAQLEVAERELILADKADPKNAEINYFQGVIYQRWQQPEKALDAYQSACTKAPTELAYLMAQAETLVSLEREDEALALLQQKVIFFEHSAVIRDAAGQLLLRKGRTADAVDINRSSFIATRTARDTNGGH